MNDVLAALVARAPIEAKVVIVVAHPDDETIGLGGSLHLFTDALLVHVTDGAPRNNRDACAAGASDWAGYAQLRRAELDHALAIGRWRGRRVEFAVPDQEASLALRDIAAKLAALIDVERPAALITHPYEGGHPDHDAVACAVHLAARNARESTSLLEFASYHADGQITARGCFLPFDREADLVMLDASEQATKTAMLAAFGSQQTTLAPFPTKTEAFRCAPSYDFTRPPHAGLLNYERYEWGMAGSRWRELAAAALRSGQR